ncbi:MAG: hypothetical protein RLZZ144_476 [Pseudomonadota bacterium]|jgi:serine/threonine-protein kinase
MMLSRLGRYEVLAELGQGAMGVVYRAIDPLIDRVVAIKTINLSLALDEKEEYERRFYQEAKAAGRLSHPNIVTIFDVGKTGDIAYMAMEYLEGRELRDILNAEFALPIEQVLDIICQIATGLAYAHEHGIVHRDIKPSNIMVVRDGYVKITDFGIARMESAAVHTQTGLVLGSPKYMSPEQVMGKPIDLRSDIFSAGVMLYEMLTGQAPFAGENVNAIMYQTLNAAPLPPSRLNVAVPDMLNFIVAKALAKDPNDRYQNAKDFADDLRHCRVAMLRQQVETPVVKSTLMANATERGDADDQTDAHLIIGLSEDFDSVDATMRFAAMTASAEELDEFAVKLAKHSLKPAKNVENALLVVGRRSQLRSNRQWQRAGWFIVIMALLVWVIYW